MTQKGKSNLMLTLAAFIWGTAFVAQSVGMDYIGPFTFNSVRSFLGSLALLPVIWYFDRKKKKETGERRETQDKKTLWIGGIACGVALAAGSSLQQVGIMYTTVGKAGFLTALYILIVPLLGVFLGKKVGKKVWTGVAIAVIGMYFLCINEKFTIGIGDTLMLLCAVVFSVHILVIDHFSPKVDGVKMSCIQFLVSGVISAFPMISAERPALNDLLAAWQPLLYAGILSSGVAYTLQVVWQKYTNPTVASLLLSLESVFSVLAGWMIIQEALSLRELFGCLLVFAAIILAQLPEKSNQYVKNPCVSGNKDIK